MTTSIDLRDKLAAVISNPGEMQSIIYDLIEGDTNGNVRVVDPNNPFVFAIEAMVALSVNNLETDYALNSQIYPSAARSYDDLYRHMADIDYLARFSTPARTNIQLLFDYNELKTKAVEVPDTQGVRRITLPRNIEVSVAGLAFTMLYPIDIDFMPYGSVTLTYDTSEISPLQTLTSNIVDYADAPIGNIRVLRIDIPVHQLRLTSQTIQLSSISDFSKTITFTNRFHYCRAYIPDGDNWTEIKTTHSDQVYDPTQPTVLLKVLNNELRIEVPQIYFNNGLMKDSVKVDIYTTVGEIRDLNLEGYEMSAYDIRWSNNNNNSSVYSAPLNTLNIAKAMSTSVVSGGTNGVSFNELRDRVILRSHTTAGLPITNNQVTANLKDLGYDIVTNVDNITDRQFLATRDLPEPISGATINAAGTTIQKFPLVIDDIKLNRYISDNQNRVTILPEALFYIDNRVLKLVNDDEVDRLKTITKSNPELLCAQVNNGNYLYTPYHYVMDLERSYFTCRAYHLTKPKVVSKYFIGDNSTTRITVGTLTQEIRYDKVKNGYVFQVHIEGDDNFKALGPDRIATQLTFKAANTGARDWINGELIVPIDENTGNPVSDIYVYEFFIDTKWDIDKNNRLFIEPSTLVVDLTHDWDVVVMVKDHFPPGLVNSDIDSITNPTRVTGYVDGDTWTGLSQERFRIELGRYLERLWTRSNVVGAPITYDRYEEDVMAFYNDNVFVRDADGNIKLTYDVDSGELNHELLHVKGDPVLDINGEQVVKYHKGDIKYVNGEPVAIDSVRKIARFVDLFLIDGKYYFSNDVQTIEHRDEVEFTITNWVTTDLNLIADRLIERSEIYFHPRSNVGTLTVKVNEGEIVVVPAVQRFKITYYLNELSFANPQLREAISTATVKGLKQVLARSVISHSDLVNHLKDSLGYDTEGVEVNGFLEDKYKTIKILNNSEMPSIGKRLVTLSNQNIRVIDDVEIEFIEI